jgi:hypothetical protein
MATEIILRNYLVAIIDVLGQRSKLRKIEVPQSDSPEAHQMALKSLQDTAGVILKLRKAFQSGFEPYKTPGPMVQSLPEQAKKKAIELLRNEIRYQYFSDSIVISLPITAKNDGCTDIIGIHQCLFTLCSVFIGCLSEGCPIRGGVDIGPCIQMPDNENEVYGAALEKAHYLESKIADYPRIAIGKDLLDYILLIENIENQSEFGLLAKKFASDTKNLIIGDSNGRFYLDILSKEILQYFEGTDISGDNLINNFEIIISNKLREYYTTNEKLFNRYIHLLQYVKFKKDTYNK